MRTKLERIANSTIILGALATGYVGLRGYLFSQPTPRWVVVGDCLATIAEYGLGPASAHSDSRPEYELPFLRTERALLSNALGRANGERTIDVPGSTETLAFGINSYDDIVGTYEDANRRFHVYLRTP